MPTNAEIRTGLADRLRTIPDLQVYERPPGEIVPDAAVIRRRSTNYDMTLNAGGGGGDDTAWGVTVFVAFSNTDAGMEALDLYLSPAGEHSIPQAIAGDATLGATVDYARVTLAEGETVTAYAGVDYLTVEFVIEVAA